MARADPRARAPSRAVVVAGMKNGMREARCHVCHERIAGFPLPEGIVWRHLVAPVGVAAHQPFPEQRRKNHPESTGPHLRGSESARRFGKDPKVHYRREQYAGDRESLCGRSTYGTPTDEAVTCSFCQKLATGGS